MEIFNGIFYGYNVLLTLTVDPVDHGGQGGGFAAARRSRDQNQPPGFLAQVRNDFGQSQFLECFDLKRDGPKSAGHNPPLDENIRAKPGKIFYAEGKIELAVFFE